MTITDMYRALLFIAIIITLSACDKWLDLEPENDQVTDNYWQNKEEVEAVLGAAYVTFRDSYPTLLAWGEARGGALNVTSGGHLAELGKWNITPLNTFAKWDKMYQTIGYANSVIAYGPAVVLKDQSFREEVMNSLLAEAFYLRALSYFYLVRTFKEVPLILEPYVNDDQKYEVAKSTEEEVFQQIIKDLKRAMENTKTEFPELWETKGRATIWAVKATLADVYLWTGEYENAIFQIDDVINSGKIGLINPGRDSKGTNVWFEMFSLGNSNESIFELQFDYFQNQTNNLGNMFGANPSDYLLSANVFEMFNEYPDDVRGEGASFKNLTTNKVWKYVGLDDDGDLSREHNDVNLIIYRMAEMYLMKAEALAMLNNFESAMVNVNLVRQRAGIDTLGVPTSQQELLSIIMNEKALEFVGEGKRWFDLLRVGKRNDYEYKEYMKEEVLKGAPAGSSALIRSKLFDVDSYYLPIYTDELKSNHLLIQNPYYEALY